MGKGRFPLQNDITETGGSYQDNPEIGPSFPTVNLKENCIHSVIFQPQFAMCGSQEKRWQKHLIREVAGKEIDGPKISNHIRKTNERQKM